MSRVGIQNDLATVLIQQMTTVFTPLVSIDDLLRANQQVSAGVLNGTATVLDGVSAALKTLVSSMEARSPAPPQKIIIE